MSVSAVGAGGGDYYAIDDYYFGKAAGTADAADRATLTWGGRGAARLGVAGPAKADDFRAVLDGRNPDPAGLPLSVFDRRMREGGGPSAPGEPGGRPAHRPGLDLTFSAPKSVSVAALVGGDDRLLGLHAAAVGRVMAYIEARHALTRQRDGKGGIERVATGHLLYAQTTHSTSRAGDPNLHTHVVVANAVYDAASGQWRALDNREIYANQVMLGLIYQRELAGGLMREGYDVRSANLRGDAPSKDGMFEIADAPAAVLAAFSKRHGQILANAQAMKPQTPAQFELAVLKNRPKKIETPAGKLRAVWEKAAADLGFDSREWTMGKTVSEPGRDVSRTTLGLIQPITAGAHRALEAVHGVMERAAAPFRSGPDVAARQVLSDALRVSESRSTVFTRSELMRRAMKSAPADVSFGALEVGVRRLAAAGRLRQADVRLHEGLTTDRALKLEGAIVAAVKDGRGRSEPLYDLVGGVVRARAGLVMPDGARIRLGDDQVRAAALILSSPDRYVAIQGVAGAGKSTMFALVGAAAREKGVTIVGMAPTHTAKAGLAEKAGFEVMTVQRFLAMNARLAEGEGPVSPKARATWRGKIVVLDEASMIDNADKLKLVQLVEALEIRKLALVGDRGQLPAISAGAPFALLLDTVIPQAEMNTLRRQREPELRAAVGDLARGDGRGLRRLEGRVVEVGELAGSSALAGAAFGMWKAAHDEGVTRPIITATQEQRSAVNGMILDHLEAVGEIARLGGRRDHLVQSHLIGPDRWWAGSYRLDQVLVFHSALKAAGIDKGEHVVVVGLDRSRTGNLLTVRREDGHIATIGLNGLARRGEEKFVAFSIDHEAQLYRGAAFVFERSNTDPAIDVKAGEAFTVLGETDGRVNLRLSSGRALSLAADDKQLRFVGPGYAMTTHRSQGLTMDVDPIGVLASRNATLAGAYVQVSRAVSGITIVTDSFERLLQGVARRDGQNLIGLLNLAERSPETVKAIERESAAPFDPSLLKPDPETSIVQDRPLRADRSL